MQSAILFYHFLSVRPSVRDVVVLYINKL